jgi:hypothetical protein
MKNLLKKGMATIVAVLMSVMLSSSIGCPGGYVPDCPFPDPPYSVFYPNPSDCNWFFHCSNGVAYCKQCPADLVWNVDLDTCDYPQGEECDGRSSCKTEWLVYVKGIGFVKLSCEANCPKGQRAQCKPNNCGCV